MFKKLTLAFIALLIAVPTTNADRRKYAWTYQPVIIAPDASELEFYQTTRLNDIDKWEYRFELEHGLSPRLDLGVYQIFTQLEGESFKWDAFQFRFRYRLSEPGQVAFDPVLYLEYQRKTDLKERNKLEGKLLLGKDFDRVNFSVNPLFEFFWAPGEPKYEWGWDAGLSYAPSYKFAMGVESLTRWEKEGDENEFAAYFGPSLSYASGEVYYTVGYLFGLNDDSDDARVRFLIGVGL